MALKKLRRFDTMLEFDRRIDRQTELLFQVSK